MGTETRTAAGDDRPTTFLFDLDGTVTAVELLPFIAERVGVEAEIATLTRDTMAGLVPFDDSLRQRVDILSTTPVEVIADIIDEAPMFDEILSWIVEHRDQCCIVTGNLDCWVDRLMRRYGLRYFASQATPHRNGLTLDHILSKETVLRQFDTRTVMIGDGANDAQIIADADVGIACALLHEVPPVVLDVADWVIMDERTMCQTLSRL